MKSKSNCWRVDGAWAMRLRQGSWESTAIRTSSSSRKHNFTSTRDLNGGVCYGATRQTSTTLGKYTPFLSATVFRPTTIDRVLRLPQRTWTACSVDIFQRGIHLASTKFVGHREPGLLNADAINTEAHLQSITSIGPCSQFSLCILRTACNTEPFVK